MKNLTVLYVCNEAAVGGAARSLLELLQIMREYVRPIVILPTEGVMQEHLNQLGITYYIVSFKMSYGKIGNYAKEEEISSLRDSYEGGAKISEIVKKEKVDLIHSNSSVSDVGAIAALMAGIPHIWHIREFLQEDFGLEFLNVKLKIRLINHAAKVISISHCVRQNYIQKYGIDSIVIYDGLDVSKYKQDFSVAQIEGENFLLVGRISEGKGQKEAIEAVRILRDLGDNVQLIIVGGGNPKYVWTLKKYIQKYQLSDNVVILPFQNDLMDLRRNVQYSLTCSKLEALGRVTIEAMLAGNIVIGANTGGTIELIGDKEERGYLYKQGNSVELARTMKKSMEDRKCNEIACLEQAYNYAMAQFDDRNYAKSIYDVYIQVLNQDVSEDEKKKNRELLMELGKKYDDSDNCVKTIVKKKKSENKFQQLFYCTNRWLHIRQNNHTLVEYFMRNSIKTIAIYGMGYLGRNLYDELEGSEVKVSYVIDRDPENIGEIIKVVSVDSEWDEVDAIVIAVIEEEERLKEWIKSKYSIKALGLTDVLAEVVEDVL